MKEISDREKIDRLCDDTGYLKLFSFDAAQYVRLFVFERGESVLSEGGEFDGFLYYLTQGRVKLFLTLSNGKTALLDFYRAPCFLGEMELLGVYGETFEVKTLERCSLLALPVERCREQMMTDCVFLKNLCVRLAEKERRRAVALSGLQGFSLSARLADFVLSASVDGMYREKNRDASEYLGVTYRHLSGTLSEFVSSGYLKKANGGYVIADEDALRRLSEDFRR